MNNTEMYVAVRNQDALEYCKKQSMLEQMVGDEKWKHYEYAAKALKKQISMKPIRANRIINQNGSLFLNDDDEYWKCPVCTKYDVPLLEKQAHCHCCGQALDWSKIE